MTEHRPVRSCSGASNSVIIRGEELVKSCREDTSQELPGASLASKRVKIACLSDAHPKTADSEHLDSATPGTSLISH